MAYLPPIEALPLSEGAVWLLEYRSFYVFSSLWLPSRACTQTACESPQVKRSAAKGLAAMIDLARFFVRPRYGSVARNQQGDIVCGLGGCIKNMYGEIMCSSVAGGTAAKGIDGVKCVGGCEPATPAHCERIILE